MFIKTAAKLIQEVCKPLQNIRLTNFMHDITFSHGQISMLMNDAQIALFYHQNKIPTLCTDEKGRTLASGIYINKVLESSRKDCAILMPLLIKIGKKFGHNYGKNSLHIVVREKECQHLYSLFFDLEENDFLHSVLNNGDLINELISQYNFTAKDLIAEARDSENRIILPTSKELATFTMLNNEEYDFFQIKLLHNTQKRPIYFSPQQSRCLVLLNQGKSAKEMSIAMKLSHRTIEHYLEKIRKQLGCTSNKQIIAMYGDQLKKSIIS